MSSATSVQVPPSADDLAPLSERVSRTAFYFESQGQWLFAWLHCREQPAHSDHGVLICPPIGHEQIHSHRGLRHLADGLAEAGFPVMRFDYHGTGDSSGSGEDPETVAAWLGNITDARTWLTNHFSLKRVTLAGLRLGATLAAQSAVGEAVDGLLLWAPVVKGRSYVREMRALSLTAADGARPPADAPEDLEAAGFVLTEQTVRDLSRLDLLQSRPHCRRALIMTRDDAPSDATLLEHLLALGIEARLTDPPGYANLMAEPHHTKAPREAVARAVDWLRAGTLVGNEIREVRDAANAARAAVPQGRFAESAFLTNQRIRERVLTISRQPNLFGVVSEPPDGAPDHRPFLVLVNAGSSYRVGPNRLYVSLAREFAANGFHSLRMDLCGLGDSVNPDGGRENDPYPATAFRDIDLTLKYLRAQFGVRRVVLMGLCSGAYAAFQTAAQLADPVLVESVLINPLTFFWGEGMSLDASPAQKMKSFQDCVASAWRPAKWLKLLSGKSKIGFGGIMRTLAERWRLRKPSVYQASAGRLNAPSAGFPTHPLQDDLPGDLERVVKAGRRLACFFARSDSGYGLLTLRAGRKVNELLRAGKMSVTFVDGADHTFSRRAPRRALARAILEHLGDHHPGSYTCTR